MEESKIPIKNIYYLLCYAWNKLDEKDVASVEGIENTEMVDLFARVLISGTTTLLKRGLDRSYLNTVEETATLRGKLLITSSIEQMSFSKGKAVCSTDEMHHNILHNQIIKSTIKTLLATRNLDKNLHNELVRIYRKLTDVELIKINSKHFNKVCFNRNNNFYDFLIKICHLIYENLLPSEDGCSHTFRDFTRDPNQMAALFESFVKNFYKHEQSQYSVKSEKLKWRATAASQDMLFFLPSMFTDVSLSNSDKKIVLDTKFYQELFLKRNYEGAKEIIRPNHLYQLMSYIRNSDSPGVQTAGILLYPSVDQRVFLKYELEGHSVLVATVDLSQPWQHIHSELLNLISTTEVTMDAS